MDYKAAGVDRDRAAQAIAGIARHAARTRRPEQLGGLGGFAGAIKIPAGYREPVLLAAADGVGTKLMLLRAAGRQRTAGIDLVAMNVNDLLAQGAEPLFFLDYIAAGRLNPDEIVEVAAGIADGCVAAGCALLGGETAEMPGMIADDALELAGFAVGVCEQSQLLDGQNVQPGDIVLGCASSGPHSNGFSLVRQVLAAAGVADHNGGLDADYTPAGWDQPLLDNLLAPTRIYVSAVRPLIAEGLIKAVAHITGGGLPDNVVRSLPSGLTVSFDKDAWPVPPVFQWLAETGNVGREAMFRTFNMGIGLTVVVGAADAGPVQERLAAELGAPVWAIGEIVSGQGVTGLW